MTKNSTQKKPYPINPATGRISITEIFGEKLALLLSKKISVVYKNFNEKNFVRDTKKAVVGKRYTQRIEIIADLLKEDEVKCVKKSVANHVRDWIKVSPKEAKKLIADWSKSKNEHTQWILKYAQR